MKAFSEEFLGADRHPPQAAGARRIACRPQVLAQGYLSERARWRALRIHLIRRRLKDYAGDGKPSKGVRAVKRPVGEDATGTLHEFLRTENSTSYF